MKFQTLFLNFKLIVSMKLPCSLRLIKSEFLKGLKNHFDIEIQRYTIMFSIIGLFSCIDYLSYFISIEFLLFINSKKPIKYFPFYVISKSLTWVLLTILSTEYLLILFPIIISWYIFEQSINLEYSARLQYFYSRYPFFYGYGLIPTILYLLTYYYPYYPILFLSYVSFCLMLSRKRNEKSPIYAIYIPYTKKTFVTDIIDVIDNYLRSF